MADTDKVIAGKLADAQKRAAEYATEANRLSEMIHRFELLLSELPSKVEAECPLGDNGAKLAFTRHAGGQWRLVHRARNGHESILMGCSIDTKLAAASAMAALVESLAVVQQSNLARLRDANVLLESLFASLKTVGKERA